MVKRSSRQSLRIEFEMKGFGWNSSANSNGHNNRIEAVVFWFPNVALSSLKDNQLYQFVTNPRILIGDHAEWWFLGTVPSQFAS